MKTIAALYVQKNGIYYGLDGVDPWDEQRNAMLYDGPHPVVAHPPCARWCRLAGFCEKRWGLTKGDDGGTFAHALAMVRRLGGVLEHPAYSSAWPSYGLPVPNRAGWQKGICGGWSCYVEQGRYGHATKKGTWLYVHKTDLPELKWGFTTDHESTAGVRWHSGNTGTGRIMSAAETSATPSEFRDILISIARSAYNHRTKEQC